MKEKPLKVAYLAYPYTDNPSKRTKESLRIAKKLVRKHPEIVPIIPHLHFDVFQDAVDPNWIPVWELKIISKCDMLILCLPLEYSVSAGMVWEAAYARMAGIPVVDIKELI